MGGADEEQADHGNGSDGDEVRRVVGQRRGAGETALTTAPTTDSARR